ncbi:alanine racemase [Sphingomonas oleivorans]|uniref:Alanine racemase n=1 Tax=Sphingomonas oleivorans TaxID=1735121 RepID=A0A2T5G285_9SPHN|nr:alanine racemase [Sphingomonas oleivorans]PTQ13240.1 alanine racemase [Sphingomonas oleivorans]
MAPHDHIADPFAGARLTIDLAALTANYSLIAARVAPARTAAVVKADAYGLGATRVAPALAEMGCRDFFVAHLAEAIALRPHLPADAALYVLNGLQPGAERRCATLGILPVLNSLDQARRWAAMAREIGHALPAVLQVDSGMSRLGLQPEEVAALAEDKAFFEQVPLRLVMSHLACADEPGNAANAEQLRRFHALAALLPPALLSFANSGGAFLPAAFHHDLVRAGVSLYGAAPNGEGPNPMRPVVRLDARIIQVRAIPAGTGVGYGLTFNKSEPARIATIGVGYADGWPRHLSNRGAAFFGGVRLPIAGRVSMDSITLDVTALAEGALGPGDEVELIGPHQTLEQVAADAGTIPYEILTSLGSRYSRIYSDGVPGDLSNAVD